ncbi:hypothetical protein KIH87_06630 [Paraneptunicella aestuarii]|uniref:hypothetical protein n=1 Tax=Paraneptunicella aestuarii TaxID=2831148 RepID=UPI001E3794E4|nr:hypothetical protein [Paraneptunicella aestuarii]UAA40019.1 hypothetical protein KIH87_06630 [Paraneptunicella aestuarii]
MWLNSAFANNLHIYEIRNNLIGLQDFCPAADKLVVEAQCLQAEAICNKRNQKTQQISQPNNERS